ncbi:MAG: magnesium and cobalt transport protein CorA [Acidobacteria bacterium RIFCSPLOWO2_12_FULL_54_10]|nr:MAG: magnesium and cobalt transport protein CorA [Acidobacteria bacterium RIFCSPLOWO2_12_FULL_54_10]
MFRRRYPPVASMPGTYILSPDSLKPKIHAMSYSAESLKEFDVKDLSLIPALVSEFHVTWLDVQGLGDRTVLDKLAEIFSLHKLAMADVVNVPQRPKVESYDGYLFLITRMAEKRPDTDQDVEQVSMFLGKNFVLTFQENYGDVLDPLRERIRNEKGPIRHEGAGYLAYSILDAVIDGFFPVLEELGEDLATLEQDALDAPTPQIMQESNQARKTLLILRRVIWPQRDAINSLLRDPHPLISDLVRVYLRDCHDHCLQIADVIESYREIVGSITNTYLSAVSNRTNEIMKVLTIMASIFIPLTFIAGIYGMNFEYMPELHFRYAYPILLLVMAVAGIGMVLYFRRQGWIGSDKDKE